MKKYFSEVSLGEFFLIMVLMIFGGFILFVSFIGFDFTLQGFGKIFFKNGLGIIIGVMFEAVVVYYFILQIKELTAKNKTITAKLVTIEAGYKHILTFKDNNGKEYLWRSSNIDDYKESQNYYIVVRNNTIIEVKGKSEEILVIKEESNWHYYWLNIYIPMVGKFEDILLLPLYYIIAFCFVFGAFQNPLCFVVFCSVLFVIGYDLYYKFIKKEE